MNNESSGEFLNGFSRASVIDLLNDHELRSLPRNIEILGEMLGFQNWEQLLEDTKSDGVERGIVVSASGKTLMVSKPFKGIKEKNGGHVNSPLFPHGIKSLDPRLKPITFIHTHPMPPEIGHLETTIFSDGDILSFFNSAYKAVVMIDEGGVHVLLNEQRNMYEQRIRTNIVDQSISRNEGGTVRDVMKSVGESLVQSGVRYFYAPGHQLSPNGTVELKDVRFLDNS